MRCRCVSRARFLRGERAGGGIGVLAPATSAHCPAAHCVNAEPFSSSCDHALIAGRLTVPTPHSFSHRKTSQGHTSVCLQGGQPLVSALLGSCKDGDRSCPFSHTCGVLLGHSPPRLAALVLPAGPFTAAFHLPLRTEKGPSPPGRALRTSQACSPRALRHRPRLNKTVHCVQEGFFSVPYPSFCTHVLLLRRILFYPSTSTWNSCLTGLLLIFKRPELKNLRETNLRQGLKKNKNSCIHPETSRVLFQSS